MKCAFAAGALLAVMGCGSWRPAPSAAPRGATVQAWVTTGNQSKLLSREPDVAFGTPAATSSLPTLVVDTATSYQRMIGFGAAFTDASVYLIQQKMTPEQREALLQDLFGRTSGIGLSFARVTMGASDFSLRHYSYDDLPGDKRDSALVGFSIDPDRADKLPVIKRALAINPQLVLVGSPWSPPAWMKTSRSLITGTLEPNSYASFADYFVKFVEAYGAEGVPIAAVTLQNEPAFEPKDYPGMRLDPAARAAVIGRFMGPAFERAGLHTQIWDWDHNWDMPQQPLALLGDATARRYVQGVAWHCYAGDVSAQTPVHDAYPEKDAYFTECSGGDWAPIFGDNLKFDVGKLIIGSTRGWSRGVVLWNLALDEHNGPRLGGCATCRGVVTINATTGQVTRNVEYFALAHASRFVRPGARRIASSTGVDGLESVAFQNADDASKVLIVLNGAATPRTFGVRAAGRVFTYLLPASAVATFVW